MSIAQMARTPAVAAPLIILAALCYAVVPSLNYYAAGWKYPMLLTGLLRLVFSAGVLAMLAVLYRPLFSMQGIRVLARVARSEWKLSILAVMTTWDVALFSLSYRFIDISVVTAMTAMTPAANVVILALLNSNWITWRQAAGLAAAAIGVALVMWAGGSTIETSGWRNIGRFGAGIALGLGMIVCGGLTVSSLRLGEILAVEWFWDELGTGAGLVWCGSMLTLALAQVITAPVFLALALPAGMPSIGTLGLMILMGLAVMLGTVLWALANGSGLRPVVNALGYLQPGWALLILALLGIAGGVDWTILAAGLMLIVGANIGMQLWGSSDI